jgi:ABC-type glutathione transport system ATPase component
MKLLRLKDIGKIYVSDENVSVGIRGVNLSFDSGEIVAITGESGSGKSTLLNVISGMDSYEEGELYINDEPTSHFVQEDWEEYRRNNRSQQCCTPKYRGFRPAELPYEIWTDRSTSWQALLLLRIV